MIKEYTIRRFCYEKFMRQVGGVVEDIVEGVLLDSMLISGKRGYYFLKDTYINSNMSGYHLFFAPYKDKDVANALLTMWDAFVEADAVETA